MSKLGESGPRHSPFADPVIRKAVYVTGTLVIIVAVWELVTAGLHASPVILRSPVELVSEFLARPGFYLANTLTTFYEIVLGFLAAALIGVALGVVIVYSEFLQASLYPIVLVLQIVPKVAVAPLLVVFLGFGLLPKIVVAVLVAFFPALVNTVTGLQSAERELLDLAGVLNASRWQEFRLVRFPNSLPYVFSGLKVAITLAVIGAIIGEFVGANQGLGFVMIIANSQLNTNESYVSLLLMSALGVGLYGILVLLERIFIPWAEPEDSDSFLARLLQRERGGMKRGLEGAAGG